MTRGHTMKHLLWISQIILLFLSTPQNCEGRGMGVQQGFTVMFWEREREISLHSVSLYQSIRAIFTLLDEGLRVRRDLRVTVGLAAVSAGPLCPLVLSSNPMTQLLFHITSTFCISRTHSPQKTHRLSGRTTPLHLIKGLLSGVNHNMSILAVETHGRVVQGVIMTLSNHICLRHAAICFQVIKK